MMYYKPYNRKIRWRLLSLVVSITFLFHFGAFLWLKDMSVARYRFFSSPEKNLAEETIEARSLSAHKRSKDLENIFNRLSAKPVQPQNLEFDFTDLSEGGISSALKSLDVSISEELQKTAPNYDEWQIDPTVRENSDSLDTLTYLDEALATNFNYFEDLQQNEPIQFNDPLDKSFSVFEQNLLIDVYGQSTNTDGTKNNALAINLKEPTLSSAEEFIVQPSQMNSPNLGIASSSDFLLDLDYTPKDENKGFFFKISLKPKPHKHFKRIKQNIFFLIDRSHSIPIADFKSAKQAVSDSLDYLHPDDEFNILIFDGKVVKLASKNMQVNPKNIKQAKHFLKTQKHGGFFATTDLYSSLDKIIPSVNEKDNEVNLAILISDGDTYINSQKQRKTLSYWSQKNKGKISLFSLAIGKNKNIALLDLLSTFNKGSLRAACTAQNVAKELETTVKSLHSPLGKDLVATILPHNKEAKISIFPKQNRLPNLYENLEFVIYGEMDQATDFTFFLQGHCNDQWLDVKKSVSLSKGSLSQSNYLPKAILLQQAYNEYEKYLQSAHSEFLDNAKNLLTTAELPLAFK